MRTNSNFRQYGLNDIVNTSFLKHIISLIHCNNPNTVETYVLLHDYNGLYYEYLSQKLNDTVTHHKFKVTLLNLKLPKEVSINCSFSI